MSTIPASQVVNIVPGVQQVGGSAIDLNAIFLDNSTRVPIGSVLSFGSITAVQNYFGPSSPVSVAAAIYFKGPDISTKKPGALLVTQYPAAAVSAYLRGGDISDLPLATLQSYNATLNVTIDGVLKTSSIDLSAATSFSNAAEIIGAALGIHGVQAAAFTGSISGTTLTAASGLTGTIGVGDVITGSGVTANTYVAAQLTGPTGGLGTYTVSQSQTVGSEALVANNPGVLYDSVAGAFVIQSGTTGVASTITVGSGALATDLLLTLATGAVLSQGANVAVPGAFMDSIIGITTNWATFTTMFDPDNGSGFAVKEAFSVWTDAQNDRYAFVGWDVSANAYAAVPSTSSYGYALQQADLSGTIPIYEPSDMGAAAFVCGWAASIDFTQVNGRMTLGERNQTGLLPGVTDGQRAINLGGNPQVEGDFGNGYNFYGVYGSGNALFTFMNRGTISGPFEWADSYVNQIWLNNSLQVALMNYLTAVGSTPFNQAGYTAIEEALSGVIQQGLDFGAYSPGVTLSASEIAAVNAAAGVDVATPLNQRGWYLQIIAALPTTRASRGPLRGKFWYADAGSIQSIELNSIAVQ